MDSILLFIPSTAPLETLWLPQTRISLQEKALGHSLLISAALPAITLTYR